MHKILRKKSKKDAASAPFRKEEGKDKSKETLPNSLMMRIVEEPEAEKEADRLSRSITSQTPEDIMREMGSRLKADFSDVRFHTDPGSAEKSRQMGARAWAQGRDVYFGKGGFEPAAAAHELVHTVQQGAVDGNVSQSMPMGAVQLKPMWEGSRLEEDEADKNIKFDANTDYRVILSQIFSTQNGNRIYHALESDLFKLIRKGAGRGFRRCTKAEAIDFLVQAAEKDYTGKTVLGNIMKMSSETPQLARKRLFDYQEFIRFLSNRLRESDLEEAAMGSNVLAGLPKYTHNNTNERKRAYELQVPGKDSEEINFNPTNDPELKQVQDAIDNAANDREAYNIFGRFTGNSSAKYINTHRVQTNLPGLKKKLKNMTRVIRDYPELQGQIGNMEVTDPRLSSYMGAVGNYGGIRKARLQYNANWDTQEGSKKRDKFLAAQGPGFFNGNLDFAGTHELGHVLGSTLIDTKDEAKAYSEQVAGIAEYKILDSVLQKNLPAGDYEKLTRYTEKDQENSKTVTGAPTVLKGMIDTRINKFYGNGHTSGYGTENHSEFFAEAFHDVYANGNKAKKTSVEIVKEYEKRQKNLTAEKFFRKKRGLWTRFRNWMKML